MKKRIMAILLSAVMILSFDIKAVAETVSTGDSPEAVICEIAEGCILEDGHEEDCILEAVDDVEAESQISDVATETDAAVLQVQNYALTEYESDWYDISQSSVTINDTCGDSCPGHIISGSTTSNTITVKGTHTVTLQDVTIDVSGSGLTCPFAVSGTCTLILSGTNTLKAGSWKAGIEVSSGNTLIIKSENNDNSGVLKACGGNYAAGIGGSKNQDGGNITIESGTITATTVAKNGAGIGGGLFSSGGNIVISGGMVTASGGGEGAGIGGGGGNSVGSGGNIVISGGTVIATGGTAGIGGGSYQTSGTFSTGTAGNAVIFAKSISDTSGKDDFSGVIFEGDSGTVYGTVVTPASSFEIPSGKTLTIGSGKKLLISSGVTLTVNGNIVGDGTLGDGGGTLIGEGTVANTIDNEFQKASAFSVIVSSEDVTYGDKLTLTATVSKAESDSGQKVSVSAAGDTMEFYVGSTLLGSASVTYDDNSKTSGKATIEIDTTKNVLNIGDNTITVEYGGSINLSRNKEDNTTTVTMIQKELSVSGLSAVDRSYDGTTGIELEGGTLSGVLDGDSVSATMPTSGTVETADAGENKKVTFSGIELTGNDAEKYTLIQPIVTVNIKKADVTLTLTPSDTTIICGGALTLTVSGVPSEAGTIAVTCDNSAYCPTMDTEGKYTVILPSKAEVYTFTVTYIGEAEGNYNDALVTTTVSTTAHTPTRVENKTATCTETGNITYWYCPDCGKYFSDEALTQEITQDETSIAAINHKNAIKVEEKAATCTEAGNTAYWYCPDCGKYFSDEALTEEITKADTVIAATDATTTGTTTAPETGDSSHVMLCFVLLAVSCEGFVTLFLYWEKRSHHGKRVS